MWGASREVGDMVGKTGWEESGAHWGMEGAGMTCREEGVDWGVQA